MYDNLRVSHPPEPLNSTVPNRSTRKAIERLKAGKGKRFANKGGAVQRFGALMLIPRRSGAFKRDVRKAEKRGKAMAKLARFLRCAYRPMPVIDLPYILGHDFKFVSTLASRKPVNSKGNGSTHQGDDRTDDIHWIRQAGKYTSKPRCGDAIAMSQ